MTRVTIDISAIGRHVKYDLDLDPSIKHHAYLIEHCKVGAVYEEEIAWLLLRTLKPGDVAVDIGANLGFFSLMMARLVEKTGFVLACEPVKKNADRLREHLKINGVVSSSVVQKAIWTQDGIVEFHFDQDDVSGGAVWDPGKWWENEKSRLAPKSDVISAIKLSTLLQLVTPPKVIKIDTEGAEQGILAEWVAQREYRVPYIVAELNPFGMKQLGYDTESFRSVMWEEGYELFFLNSCDALPTYIPPEVKVAYNNGCQVKNVLFSTFDDVAKAWPEAIR